MNRRAGLSTGPLGAEPAAEHVLAWLDRCRPPAVVLLDGVDQATRLGEGLRARGTHLLAWAEAGVAGGRAPDAAGLARAAERGGRAGAAHVLVAGGPLPPAPVGKAAWRGWVETTDEVSATGAPAPADRRVVDRGPSGGQAAPVEALVRVLHGAVRRGTPLVVANGAAADLLGHVELGWLLDELPQVRVAFDAAAADDAHRRAAAPAAADVLDRLAARIAWVRVAGTTSDGQGGAHPEEGGIPWGTLAARSPRAAPWILDLAPGTAEDVVEDAWRWLGAWTS